MVRRLFGIIIVCLLVIFPGPSYSQGTGASSYQHPQTGIAFPASLGPLAYQGIMDYGKKGRPDIGVSLRYTLPGTSTWADIYLYDLGLKKLGTGLASPIVKKAFQGAVQDMYTVEKQGIYKSVRQTGQGEAAVSTPGGRLPLLWSHFTYERLPGPNVAYAGPLISDLYLTAYKDFFLKIRISSPAAQKDQHQQALQRFLEDLGKILKETKPE